MGSLAALARLPSNFTRHGEKTCASAYFVPLITRHGELGASWGRANVPLCLFLALLCLFLVFLICSVP